MKKLFELDHWRVVSANERNIQGQSEAVVKILVKGEEVHTAATGVGPVDALYNALSKALKNFYPVIKDLSLTDYLVHIKDSDKGTAAEVKVIVEMRQGGRNHIAKSSSTDILEASWNAIVEAIENLI